jgi:hypothetical protein
LGEHTITVKATAPDGAVREAAIVVDVAHQDYSIIATPQSQSVNVNESLPLTVELNGNTTDGITYQLTHEYDPGSVTGVVRDQNNNVITPGNYTTVNPGNYNYSFTGNNIGAVNMKFKAKDSNNQLKEDAANFTVNNVPYTFTGSSENNEVYINDTVGLNFSLTNNTSTPGITYTISYSQSQGNGTVLNGTTTINPSNPSSIAPGQFTYNFVPSTLGDHTLNFAVTDNFGQTNTVVIHIEAIHLPVTFTVNSVQNTLVGQNEGVNFNITPIENIGVTYQMSYTLSGGSGILTNTSDVEVAQGVFFGVNTGNFVYHYKPTIPGNHTLNFQLKDSNGQIINKTVTIVVAANDYTLTCNGGGAMIVNTSANFVNSIQQTTTDSSITYQVMYSITSGSGIIKDSNGNTINTDQWLPITIGATTRSFTGTTVGNAVVQTQVKDSNNIIHTCSSIFTVNNISYTFTGSAQSGSIYVTESTGLNFSITEGAPSGTAYEMMYSITSGSGTITNSGNTMNSSTYYPVNVGAYSWNFTAAAVPSNVTILFTVRNTTTGVTATQTVNIVVANYPACTFTFDATSTSSTADVNQSVPVNLSLIEGGINCTVTYQMRFTTTGSGTNTFTYNGTAYTAGQLFTVTPGNFSGTYKGVSAGVHNIDFIVVNSNSTPITHNDAVSITFNASDFTLNCSGGGALFLNGTKEFINSFYQTQNDPAITYQVRYTLASGSTATGTVKDINGNVLTLGQWYPILVGATSRTFTGTSVGTANVFSEIKDSNNIVHSCTTVMTVNNISYTFTGSSQSGSIYVTESTGLNFSITEGAPSGTNYEMMYSITSGSGTITNSGNTMNSSTYYPVNVGAYSWNFTAAAVPSNVTILFTVRNTTTGVTATQTVNIVVANYPACTFTFDATSTSSTADVNQSVPVNLSLIEGGINCTVTYQMRFTTTGSGTNTFTYNGTAYTAGQLFTVTPGNFSGTYKGVSAGTHDIDFIVVNSNSTPITHNDAVSITFNASDFTLNCSGGGALFLNGTKEFINSFYQTQNDPAITYQVRYTLGTGSTATGTVKDINGNVLTLGQWYPISVGATSRTFTGTSVGTANVFTEIKDSNNIVHSCTTVMTVNNISYTFTGSAQSGSIYVTESTGLNFSITEGAPSGTNYEMMYSITSGSGTITNSGNTMNSSTYYPVNVGAYSWNFTAAAVPSNVTILFTVRNTTTGVTATQTVNIVVANYPACTFTFDATSTSSTADVNQSVPVNLSLIEGGINCTVTYQMRFTTTGSGTNTFTYNGTAYTAGQLFTVTPGNFSGTYKGVSAGVHDIDFIVVNSNSTPITHNDAVSITFNASDFTLNCSGGGALFLNGTKEFINSFYQTQNDPAITYQVRYTLGTGSTATGTVKDINGNVLTLGQWYPISVGATSRTFTGTSVGTANVFTEIKDSNNIVHSCTTVMTVNNISYTFTGSAQSGSIYVTESTGLNFSITEGAPSGTSYEMMYSITSGSGTITNSGNTMTSSTYYPVNVGAFSWNFTAAAVPSNVSILFTVRNTTTGVTATQTINIVVANYPACTFTFDATSTSSTADVNQSVPVNLSLIEGGINCTVTYQMRFTTTGSGTNTFTYNGTAYTAGQLFTVTPGNFSGTYKGVSAGVHDIDFIVVNSNSTPITHNDAVSITFNASDFTLNCSGGGALFLNGTKEFINSFYQTQNDPAITYQVRYTLASGSTATGTVKDSDGNLLTLGQWYPISVGATSRTFTGTSVGTANVFTEIKDSNNIVHSCTTVMTVNNISYTFTGSAQSGSIYVTESTGLNFSITEGAPSGTSYEMMYSITSGSGTITNSGNTMTSSTYYPVNVGAFSWNFTAAAVPSNVSILFTVRNTTTGVTATQTINITVSSLPYCDFVTFDAQALSTSAYMNTSAAINFLLQTDNYCQGTYQMKFNTSGTGTFTYNGTTYQPNVLFTIIPGNFSGTYTGSTTGNHNIVFTVYNSMTTGIDINDNITINYYQTQFDLTCYGGGEVNVGEFDTFTNIIDQNIEDPNVTYESRYTITTTDGAGTVATNDGTTIPLGTWVSIPSGTTNRRFYGTVGGDVTLLTEIREPGNNATIQSCNSTFEVIDENCDYIFVHADESNGQGAINTLQTINFQIIYNASNICNTPYTMYYSTKRNGVATSDGYFINDQNNSPINDPYQTFQILPGTFTGQFTTNIPGNYEISFYVNNPNASTPTQVKTAQIEFIIPEVTITITSENNSVFVLDNANYSLNISGGGVGNSSVKVTPVGNSLNSILKINGTTRVFGEVVTGINDNFTIILTPNEVGNAVFNVEVVKNGITSNYNIELHSLVPQFTLQGVLGNSIIWSDDTGTMSAIVSSTYNHSINYTYQLVINDQYGNIVGTGSNINVNGNPPSNQTLYFNPGGNFGTLTAVLTVTNQFGYTQNVYLNFTSKDVLFNIESMIISTTNPLSHYYYGGGYDATIWYYDHIVVNPQFILGKYGIGTAYITINWHSTSSTGISPTSRTTNENLNYINNKYTMNLGATRAQQTSSGKNANVNDGWWWIYEGWSLPKVLMRNLDNPIGSLVPTLTITVNDLMGNSQTKTFNLNNGWSIYYPN